MKNVASLILLVCSIASTAHSQAAKTAPPIVLKDLRGKTVRLSDFKGRIVLVNFWATWCSPCAAEIPDLVKWQSEFKSSGLQIVGVTFPPTSAASVKRFVKAKKVNYPILLGTRKIKLLFDPTSTLPVTAIIDKSGKVIGTIKGVVFQDEFDEKIRPLLN